MSENRRQRIRRLTTRAGMRAAAEMQRQRRGDALTHRYVVGRFRMVREQVVLEAIEFEPATWALIRPLKFTSSAHRFYRWGTKQAAAQFVARHNIADVHVLNIHFLDVLPAEVATPSDAGGLTGGQRIDPEA